MRPIPARPGEWPLARRILFAAVVLQLYLVAVEVRHVVRGLVDPSARTQSLFRGYDGTGYYGWLRSPLIDGDWNFDNEFAHYRSTQPGEPELSKLPSGREINIWSVGPAVVWAVTVCPVHLVVHGDGYSPPYQMTVAVGSILAGFLNLALMYRIANLFAGPTVAAAAATLMTMATPVIGYNTADLTMAHGMATTALAGFFYYWLRTTGDDRPRRWLTLGLLLGIACLFRWQLATFALLPAAEALTARNGILRRGTLAAVGWLVGFLPQMIAWQIVYGQPLVQPHNPEKHWLDPSLVQVLFSADRGFFYWTPATLLAFVGLFAAGRVGRTCAVAVAVQVYFVASVIGVSVYLGGSFGFRMLTETCVVLIPGAVVLFVHRPRVMAAVGGALIVWNLLQLGVHRFSIDGFHEGNPAQMAYAAYRYVALRAVDAVVVLVLGFGLVRMMWQGLSADAAPVPAGRWRWPFAGIRSATPVG